MFHHGHLYVESVPTRIVSWNTTKTLPREEERPEFSANRVSRLIASPRRSRYSLLIGTFGTGKTTAALHAAENKGLSVIHVRAAEIERSEGSQGTNFLMRNIGRSLDLLDELPPESVERLTALAGAALARILRQANDQFFLVIDGLDEHSFYSTQYGLQWLTNELAELRCPIVLTTRTEHLELLAGNFRLAVGELSKRGGARRTIEILELGPWTKAQAISLIQLAQAEEHSDAVGQRLSDLAVHIRNSSSDAPSHLLAHPLFLQMTMDLIVDGESEIVNDPNQLMESWIELKILRDLRSPRLSSTQAFSVDDYVYGMIEAMREIAQRTVMTENDQIAYQDEIDLDDALSVARRLTGLNELSFAEFISTSLFVPLRTSKHSKRKIRFFHRAVQEHLARGVETARQ